MATISRFWFPLSRIAYFTYFLLAFVNWRLHIAYRPYAIRRRHLANGDENKWQQILVDRLVWRILYWTLLVFTCDLRTVVNVTLFAAVVRFANWMFHVQSLRNLKTVASFSTLECFKDDWCLCFGARTRYSWATVMSLQSNYLCDKHYGGCCLQKCLHQKAAMALQLNWPKPLELLCHRVISQAAIQTTPSASGALQWKKTW